MSLHVESQGSGAPLLMLHGWGMHSGMWGESADILARHALVRCLDLPGHGYSAPLREGQVLDDLVHVLAGEFEESLVLCGWSLGGLVALRWAELYPQQIKKMVLVASTPCFMQRTDWGCAMPADILQAFSGSLSKAWQSTLLRFLSLQVQGGEDARATLLTLREKLLQRGEPHQEALQDGLAMLRDTDMRPALPHIVQPTLLIAGEQDTLVPFAAIQYMTQALPNARLASIAGAAHVPFMSHTQNFVDHVVPFLRE